MRAAPALQVTVSGRGVWRWLVAALAVASAAAAAWWCAVRLGNPAGSMALGVGVASVLAAIIALRALSRPPQDLRFDGQCWWLGASPAVDAHTRSTDVAVVIDLGAWMLLRFDAPADETCERCRRWLAVERRELGPQWHALRCAVYSPRPGAPSVSRAAPVDPSSRE
jgi:hypothetical protein